MDLLNDINDENLANDNDEQVITQYFNNKFKQLNNEKKINNNLIHSIMTIVEIYFSKRGSGEIKRRICLNVLNFLDQEYVLNTIEFIIKHKLLPKKNLINYIKNFLLKRKLKKQLRI